MQINCIQQARYPYFNATRTIFFLQLIFRFRSLLRNGLATPPGQADGEVCTYTYSYTYCTLHLIKGLQWPESFILGYITYYMTLLVLHEPI